MSKVFKNPQEKVCFVIPIHPPNYRFLPNLRNITKKSGVKIFLVLTEKDSALEQKYTCFEYILPLICSTITKIRNSDLFLILKL